jgi:hypothetical protein
MYGCRTMKHANVGNALPFAVVLTGLWIVLNTNSPLDETWNYLFGFAIGILGLVALLRG